ncbi:MAG: hypothetical protein VB099_15450 [Candidatus Limiplasma sp.]|nr:hypothetical protein [Candidatus Limiplasma sp.]
MDIMRSATATPVYYHLAFMYQMIGVYLMMPLIQMVWGRISLIKRSVLCLGLLVLSRFSPFIQPISQGCVYAAIGACCVEWVEKWKGSPSLTQRKCMAISVGLFFIYLVASITTAWLTNQCSILVSHLDERYLAYNSILICIASISLMAGFLLMPLKQPQPQSLVFFSKWNALTLGIYLIHPLLMDLLQNEYVKVFSMTLGFRWDQWDPKLSIPMLAFLCYIASAVIILCYHKTRDCLRKSMINSVLPKR